MKIHFIAALTAALVLAGCATTRDATPPVAAVAQLDLARYAGKWFEIARFDQYFQRGCVGVYVEYGAIDASTVSVNNVCRIDKLDGPVSGITGRATRPDAAAPAKLKVRFDRFPVNLFSADYWVVALDNDYRWAVVSNERGSVLWILSRTPSMNAATYDSIVTGLKARGIKTEYLIRTLQPTS
ncbi:MAG: lipocalin family protein [Burkholderiales bacterium]